MNSEKVKEIKECLEVLNEYGETYITKDKTQRKFVKYADILTLINELESENERLVKELEDMPIPFMGCMLENQLLSDISKEKNGEIKTLKDRIALLEKENETLRNAKFSKRLTTVPKIYGKPKSELPSWKRK